MANHIRSISVPSTSYPATLKVEEELYSLKARLASSSRTAQMICNGLSCVTDLYELVEELLRLPSNQHSLQPSQKKWVEEQLDESLKMLDLIAAVKDCLVAMKEHVQDLRSTIRRKGNAPTVSNKKAQKLIKDCLRALKRMDGKPLPHSVAIKESDMVVKVFMEARGSTTSILQSTLSLLLKPKQKTSRWFTVSKIMSKRRVACEGECDGATDEEGADMWLQPSYACLSDKDVDAERVLKAQNHLESLEIKMENIESGIECLFRRLIQNRVSLLNLLGL